MTATRHYQAFISYSHNDENWARWLQRALEKYALPKTLRHTHPHLPKRLYPIFRDRDELASGVDLSESIRKAMDDSAALIVICSPSARASRWVNEEIRRFQASGRSNRIFCLLVEGSPDPLANNCAFPNALLKDDSGQVLREPLAADVSPSGDGKRNAMLKIAAGLLDVGVDDLKRRDAQRQARFWSIVAFSSLFIAALTIGLAIYALNAKKESELRRQQAEGLIGFMLGDLRDKLEPIGKLDILDAVGDQSMKYFATLGNQGSTKEMLERGKALRQIGEVRKSKGEQEDALKAFEQSLKQMQALHNADPSNNDYLFELGQAEFWVGYVAWERGDLQRAEATFNNYMRYSRELLKRDPGNSDYNMELSYAYSNLGSAARARGKTRVALDNFILSRDINAAELKKHPEDIELTYGLAEAWSWIGSTKMDLGDLSGSDEAFAEISKLLRPIYEQNDNARATFTLASNMAFQTEAKLYIGDRAAAKAINVECLKILSMLTAKDPKNAEWLQVFYKAKYHELALIAASEWSDMHDDALKRLLSGAKELSEKDTTSSKNKILHAAILRELALRHLHKNDFSEALSSAQAAHKLMLGVFKDSDKSPQIYAEYAKSAETFGTALMANKQTEAAVRIWGEAAALLDKQTYQIFDFKPIRLLLAIDLEQASTIEETQKLLKISGYRDPRMQKEHTLSGAFIEPQ